MKKILFIDRDGTLVIEPPIDFQLDSLEKLEFYPGVFQGLGKIAKELDYMFVMVTNQDGLGTDAFPETTFQPAHSKILQAFENEGIKFDAIHIDRSFPHENAPTRKPRTGMLTEYMNNDYDLGNSFVIGDRVTDVQLAENMGCKSIFFGNDSSVNANFITTSWIDIYTYLKNQTRTSIINRTTSETDIYVKINLDGNGKSDIETGIGFFDHMLHQIAKHAGIDLSVRLNGDINVDEHHSIEDLALTLGQAFAEALGTKRGIARYGFFILPMDENLAQVAIDFGGRPYLVWNVDFKREKIGEMPTEMIEHFFKSFSDTARCNLNIKAEGTNEHHKAEAVFKAFAKAVKSAITFDGTTSIPSTKGIL